MPVEPPPSQWNFPDPARYGEGEVVGLGADLEPGTILAAYRAGIFPMPLRRPKPAWWAADEGGREAAARAGRLLDVQWRTDRLASLGAVEVSRRRYGELLERALRLPLPSAFAAPA